MHKHFLYLNTLHSPLINPIRSKTQIYTLAGVSFGGTIPKLFWCLWNLRGLTPTFLIRHIWNLMDAERPQKIKFLTIFKMIVSTFYLPPFISYLLYSNIVAITLLYLVNSTKMLFELLNKSAIEFLSIQSKIIYHGHNMSHFIYIKPNCFISNLFLFIFSFAYYLNFPELLKKCFLFKTKMCFLNQFFLFVFNVSIYIKWG